jgi:hypothetical protein
MAVPRMRVGTEVWPFFLHRPGYPTQHHCLSGTPPLGSVVLHTHRKKGHTAATIGTQGTATPRSQAASQQCVDTTPEHRLATDT